MGMYCGIDLHATNGWLCVVDETGVPQLEVEVSNRLDEMRERLEPYRDELRAVAVESTFNRYWLVVGLSCAPAHLPLEPPAKRLAARFRDPCRSSERGSR